MKGRCGSKQRGTSYSVQEALGSDEELSADEELPGALVGRSGPFRSGQGPEVIRFVLCQLSECVN